MHQYSNKKKNSNKPLVQKKDDDKKGVGFEDNRLKLYRKGR